MVKNSSWVSMVDETFDSTLSQSYYMSIRISADGLSFCILDPVRNVFVLFGNQPMDLQNGFESLWTFIESEPVLGLEYQKVVVIVDNRFAVLVPGMIYKADRAADLLSFTFSADLEDFSICENRIKLADAINVFAVPNSIVERFLRLLGDVVFLHATTPLLESNMIDDLTVSAGQTVRLHFVSGRFYVFVVDRRNLLLFNQFDIYKPNDLIYFLLFAIEQMQLPTKEIELILTGEIQRDDANFQLLKCYFKKIRFERMDKHVCLAPALREVDYPRNFQLFNFALCV